MERLSSANDCLNCCHLFGRCLTSILLFDYIFNELDPAWLVLGISQTTSIYCFLEERSVKVNFWFYFANPVSVSDIYFLVLTIDGHVYSPHIFHFHMQIKRKVLSFSGCRRVKFISYLKFEYLLYKKNHYKVQFFVESWATVSVPTV